MLGGEGWEERAAEATLARVASSRPEDPPSPVEMNKLPEGRTKLQESPNAPVVLEGRDDELKQSHALRDL